MPALERWSAGASFPGQSPDRGGHRLPVPHREPVAGPPARAFRTVADGLEATPLWRTCTCRSRHRPVKGWADDKDPCRGRWERASAGGGRHGRAAQRRRDADRGAGRDQGSSPGPGPALHSPRRGPRRSRLHLEDQPRTPRPARDHGRDPAEAGRDRCPPAQRLPGAGARPGSTRSPTRGATSSSAPSLSRSSGEDWPPAMTSSPSPTALPSSSRPASPGPRFKRHALVGRVSRARD